MPFNIGAPELIIILIIALIVLGPGRLPDVAQSLGKSVREFRKAATDLSDATNLSTPPATPTSGSTMPVSGEKMPATARMLGSRVLMNARSTSVKPSTPFATPV